MMNGKHRARWLAEIVSEMQRFHKKARGSVEDGLVAQALEKLQAARETALTDESNEGER